SRRHRHRAAHRRSTLFEPDDWRRIVDGDLLERTDDVIDVQAKGNYGGLTVGDDGPGVFVLGRELPWHGDHEHPVVPSRKEMRRLAQVGATRLDLVGRTDRNIELLGRVAIQVSDEKTAAAIVVVEPALE